jgi:hypothetical protein
MHPFQIFFYMLHSRPPRGVLTNGRRWRLYHETTASKLEASFEIDLPDLLVSGDVERFFYFYAFFRRTAFRPGHPLALKEMLQASIKSARDIRDDLRGQVYDALNIAWRRRRKPVSSCMKIHCFFFIACSLRPEDEQDFSEASFIGYRDLSERHLGTIYEGLWGYTLYVANEPVVALRSNNMIVPKTRAAERDSVRTYQPGEVYLVTDAGQRKTTGSYYASDYLVK